LGGLLSFRFDRLVNGHKLLTRNDARHRANGGGQQVVQNNNYYPPPGYSPAAYAAALEQNNRRLKAELYDDLSRPGRPLYHATRR